MTYPKKQTSLTMHVTFTDIPRLSAIVQKNKTLEQNLEIISVEKNQSEFSCEQNYYPPN